MTIVVKMMKIYIKVPKKCMNVAIWGLLDFDGFVMLFGGI